VRERETLRKRMKEGGEVQGWDRRPVNSQDPGVPPRLQESLCLQYPSLVVAPYVGKNVSEKKDRNRWLSSTAEAGLFQDKPENSG
jgi:hypothetical protein